MSWSQFRDAKTRAQWRDRLLREQNGLCGLCGNRFPEPGLLDSSVDIGFAPTFDHIVPKAHGGEDALENLRLAHRACNHIRGNADGLKRMPQLPRALVVRKE
jgi:5-methylcytosine-specific restriction endonuclease McrA